MNNGQAVWQDSLGRNWSTRVTVATVGRVRTLTGRDLLAVFDGQLLQDLAADPCLLAEVLFAVCQPQAADLALDAQAFGDLLTGETLEAGANALVAGIANFFPPARRAILATLWAKLTATNQAAEQLAVTKLNGQAVERALTKALQAAELEMDRRLAEMETTHPRPESTPS